MEDIGVATYPERLDYDIPEEEKKTKDKPKNQLTWVGFYKRFLEDAFLSKS